MAPRKGLLDPLADDDPSKWWPQPTGAGNPGYIPGMTGLMALGQTLKSGIDRTKRGVRRMTTVNRDRRHGVTRDVPGGLLEVVNGLFEGAASPLMAPLAYAMQAPNPTNLTESVGDTMGRSINAASDFLAPARREIKQATGIDPAEAGEAALNVAPGAKTVGLMGAAGKTLPAMFMGIAAKKAPLKRLKNAQEMLASGKSAEEVRKATGWFKHPVDNQWRWEISDKDMKLKFDPYDLQLPGALMDFNTGTKFGKKGYITLGDVIDHPELFRNYPELKTARFEFNEGSGGGFGLPYDKERDALQLHGKWGRKSPLRIRLGSKYFDPSDVQPLYGKYLPPHEGFDMSKPYEVGGDARLWALTPEQHAEGLRQDILHEIQHAVQSLEGGFGQGGSPTGPGTAAYENYLRLSGEAEARNTGEFRSWMGDADRRKYAPGETQDVPYGEQTMGKSYVPYGLLGLRDAGGLTKPGSPFRIRQPGDAPWSTIEPDEQLSARPQYARGPKKVVGQISPTTARRRGLIPTVTNPLRVAYPGIYKQPRQIIEDARGIVAPEHEALKELFGVTRRDLSDIAGSRSGLAAPDMPKLLKSRGSEYAENVTTPRNAQRIYDNMELAQRELPDLWHGMKGWYVMDPAYQLMEKLHGPEKAKVMFDNLNAFTAMSSPSSDVIAELNRGTAANWLNNVGRWDDFERAMKTKVRNRGGDFPSDLLDVAPHPYAKTAMIPNMRRWRATGRVTSSSKPKVSTYFPASGVPYTSYGFNTEWPVGDAHFGRGIGLPDVRTRNQGLGGSLETTEAATVAPWWRNISRQLDVSPVSGQAINWGLLGPQTGVKTKVGAGKLELLAQEIWEKALREGRDPRTVRDEILSGRGGHVGLLKSGKFLDED